MMIPINDPPEAALGLVTEDETVIKGASSTVMPRTLDAKAAVPRLAVRAELMASPVVVDGTVILAVMRTDAGVTVTDTSDVLTPAATAKRTWGGWEGVKVEMEGNMMGRVAFTRLQCAHSLVVIVANRALRPQLDCHPCLGLQWW